MAACLNASRRSAPSPRPAAAPPARHTAPMPCAAFSGNIADSDNLEDSKACRGFNLRQRRAQTARIIPHRQQHRCSRVRQQKPPRLALPAPASPPMGDQRDEFTPVHWRDTGVHHWVDFSLDNGYITSVILLVESSYRKSKGPFVANSRTLPDNRQSTMQLCTNFKEAGFEEFK